LRARRKASSNEFFKSTRVSDVLALSIVRLVRRSVDVASNGTLFFQESLNGTSKLKPAGWRTKGPGRTEPGAKS
jgi:hypothetical protein